MRELPNKEGHFWVSATIGGDVRFDVYDSADRPIVYFIISKDEANTVAAEIVTLAGFTH